MVALATAQLAVHQFGWGGAVTWDNSPLAGGRPDGRCAHCHSCPSSAQWWSPLGGRRDILGLEKLESKAGLSASVAFQLEPHVKLKLLAACLSCTRR